MNKKDTIRHIFRDIVGGSQVDEAEIRRLFAVGYVQKVDGKTLDLDGFIAHMRAQKQHIAEAETEFLALAEDGGTVFSNHIVRAKKADGSRIAVQVLAQFEFDETAKSPCATNSPACLKAVVKTPTSARAAKAA